MKKNIALIGVGGIGSRHLQALTKLKDDVNIWVVDPSSESIDKAKKLLDTENSNQNKANIPYCHSVNEIPSNIDVAIIATTSGIRRAVTEELIAKCNVKNIIFEKVLFTKVEDYYAVQKILEQYGISAWVNCGRRLFDFYVYLKSVLIDANSIDMYVSGKNFGLGCNAIHYLDLLAYLGRYIGDIDVDISDLDREIIPSKRKGYVEFTGKLCGKIGTYSFTLVSSLNDCPNQIILKSNVCDIFIEEKSDVIAAKIIRHDNTRSEENIKYPMQFVSGLTNHAVHDILVTGDCNLTSYEDSMKLHIPMIKAFLEKINADIGVTDICNIT
ncbi:Gfo/Idh/MocA family oxidoreductase [Methanomicrobium mobile]|uniref:Gfo/Idh/MocA family oxidoreductase n=1 Tax=Methanomicrobium mobile TaxID=2205 RepID=UPI0005B2CA66|nr:Gfo/Idh/MocA family oxidoreductase [Methanomicrobium mobile]